MILFIVELFAAVERFDFLIKPSLGHLSLRVDISRNISNLIFIS